MVIAHRATGSLFPGIYKFLLFALCVFGLVKDVVRPWLKSKNVTFVTDLLRRKDSQLASATLASVELANSESLASKSLVEAHQNQVSQSLKTIRWQDILPSKRLIKRTLLTIFAMVLTLALFQRAPEWLLQHWNALRFGQSAKVELATKDANKLKTSSLFRDLRLTLHPPEYTGLPKRVLESSSGEVTLLPGTYLEIQGHTKSASASVKLERWTSQNEDDIESIKMETTSSLKGHSQFTSSWQVMSETQYKLSALKESKKWATDPKIRTISVEEDLPPRVDFQFPKDNLVVQNDTDIEIAYWIKDDYGIETVKLLIKDGDTTSTIDFFASDETPKLSLEETKTWTFKTDAFSTGVPLPVTLEVKDNDTISGPKATLSKTFFITIQSMIDKESNAIDAIKVLTETLIESLARRLPLEASKTPASQSDINLSSQISTLFQQAIVDVSKVKKNNREWLAVLRNMSKTHEKWLAKERDQKPTTSTNSKWLKTIETDVLKLLDWLKRKQIEHIRARQKEIEAQQERIAKLMKEHAENPTPESEANLMRALEKLEKQMADLAKEQAQLPSDVIDEFVNKDAAQNNAEGEKCLDKVKSLLAQGDTNAAMAQMTKCKEEMEKRAKQMERSLDSLKSSDSLNHGKAQAQWMNKLNSILDKQQKISEQTKGEQKGQEESQEGQEESQEGQGQPSPLTDSEKRQRLLEAQKKLAEATKQLSRDPENKNSSTLEHAAQEMKDASESLKKRDGQSAEEHMESALKKLNKAVKEAQNNNQQGEHSENREKIDLPDKDDHQIPKELREDILEAMKRGEPPPEYKPLLKKYYEAITK